MSRTGKKPISLPEKVDVKFEGLSITVKGPKGELQRTLPNGVSLSKDENFIFFLLLAISRGRAMLAGCPIKGFWDMEPSRPSTCTALAPNGGKKGPQNRLDSLADTFEHSGGVNLKISKIKSTFPLQNTVYLKYAKIWILTPSENQFTELKKS